MSNRAWNLTKTNQLITAQGTMLATHKRLMRTLKDSILTVPGCTVKGSSNGVAAGMDGTDRWATDADLLWNTNGVAHSWIVFKFANMGNVEMLLRLPLDANGASVLMTFSAVSLYTGGSATSDPTAADAVTVFSGAALISSADGHYVLHVPVASDGKQFSVVYLRSGACYGFVQFGLFTPDTPGAWQGANIPIFALWSAQPAAAAAASWSYLGNIANTKSVHASTAINTAYLSCEGWQAPAGGTPAQLGVANSFNGRWPMYPIGIASEQATKFGKLGTIPDLAFIDTVKGAGDIYQLPDDEYWAVFDDVAIPWGSATNFTPPQVSTSAPATTYSDAYEVIPGRISGGLKSFSPAQGNISDDPDIARWTPITVEFTAPNGMVPCIVVVMGGDSSLWMVAYDDNLGGWAPLFSDKSSLSNGVFSILPNGGWMKSEIRVLPYAAMEAV